FELTQLLITLTDDRSKSPDLILDAADMVLQVSLGVGSPLHGCGELHLLSSLGDAGRGRIADEFIPLRSPSSLFAGYLKLAPVDVMTQLANLFTFANDHHHVLRFGSRIEDFLALPDDRVGAWNAQIDVVAVEWLRRRLATEDRAKVIPHVGFALGHEAFNKSDLEALPCRPRLQRQSGVRVEA